MACRSICKPSSTIGKYGVTNSSCPPGTGCHTNQCKDLNCNTSKAHHLSVNNEHQGNVTERPISGKVVHYKKNSYDTCASRNSPNDYIWQKIEEMVDRMISGDGGIPIRNIKSLMSFIPSTFTGSDIVHWLMEQTNASDVTEATHLASRIAALGYLFPIDDHVLTVKNDTHAYYRFQTPFLYPSRCPEADTIDYAVYLCKRTMQNKQRLELTGFEAERLASLQNHYYHKWEFIYIQAEAEAKVDKKRDKLERLVLDSQERAYWDVHRPPPGCVNTTDVDMRKLCRAKRPEKVPSRPVNFPIASGPAGQLIFPVHENVSPVDLVAKLNACFRPRIKTSKAAESLQNYCDQYSEFDLLLSATAAASAAAAVASVSGSGSGPLWTPSPTNLVAAAGGGGGCSPGGIASSTSIGRLENNSAALPVAVTGSGGDPLVYSTAMVAALGATGSSAAATAASASANSNACSDEPASALNPWISDNPDYWTSDVQPKYLPIKRIKRWGFSIYELLKDPVGREEFQRWLEKEFSAENLRFWQACQELKGAPLRELRKRVLAIYNQYLAPNAVDPLNVDSRALDSVRRQLGEVSGTNLDRYCFEEAEGHIFHLMKSDSYYRFLRSDYYRELFTGSKKKSKRHRAGGTVALNGSGVSALTSSTAGGGAAAGPLLLLGGPALD